MAVRYSTYDSTRYDLDGILDSLDSCPMIDETYNKFQDDDGCPDFVSDAKGIPDTDGDGISDYVDSCPNQPETYNGILDSDGCPDKGTSGDSDSDKYADEFDQCN